MSDSQVPVAIRNSEVSLFKDCRQAWQWAYVEYLRTKRVRSALAFGSLMHLGMEHWYVPGIKRGVDPRKTITEAYNAYIEAGGQPYMVGDYEPLELGVAMFDNYLEEYGKDERYKVIAAEQTFQVDVFHPKSGRYLFTAVGTIDGVWYDRQTRKIVFAEHKTGAGLTPFGAPVALDEQSGMYWAYGPAWLQHKGILKPGQMPDALMFNRLRKHPGGDDRPKNADGLFLNKNGSISKNQGSPLFKREMVYRTDGDRRNMMIRVRKEAKEMEMARAGRLAIYKNPGRHCGYCEFFDMCEVHETGSDWKAMRDELFTTWDPYEDHAAGMSDEPAN